MCVIYLLQNNQLHRTPIPIEDKAFKWAFSSNIGFSIDARVSATEHELETNKDNNKNI